LTAVPRLRLIVGHLGGAAWKQASALASDFPEVAFESSEILAWLGAPNAPTALEFVSLVRDIVIERVEFGSDFPWYDPGPLADVVRNLPIVTETESPRSSVRTPIGCSPCPCRTIDGEAR
jgi:predicted TIM-barrel fold metal-dependent hydrolase